MGPIIVIWKNEPHGESIQSNEDGIYLNGDLKRDTYTIEGVCDAILRGALITFSDQNYIRFNFPEFLQAVEKYVYLDQLLNRYKESIITICEERNNSIVFLKDFCERHHIGQ